MYSEDTVWSMYECVCTVRTLCGQCMSVCVYSEDTVWSMYECVCTVRTLCDQCTSVCVQ